MVDFRVFLARFALSVIATFVKGDSTDREYENEKHSDRHDYSESDVAVFPAAHGRPDLSGTATVGATLLD